MDTVLYVYIYYIYIRTNTSTSKNAVYVFVSFRYLYLHVNIDISERLGIKLNNYNIWMQHVCVSQYLEFIGYSHSTYIFIYIHIYYTYILDRNPFGHSETDPSPHRCWPCRSAPFPCPEAPQIAAARWELDGKKQENVWFPWEHPKTHPQKQIDHYKLAILILKIMFHIIMITIGYKELMSLKMFASKASWDSTPNVAPLGHVPLRPQHLGKKEGTLDGELVQGSFQHFWISLGDLGVSQNIGFPTRINHCWEIWAGVFLLKKM